MADRSEKFVLMSLGAIKIQELLKDKFDYRSQGYCSQHKCFIIEGPDGCPECPSFLDKYHSMSRSKNGKKSRIMTKKEEDEFGFGSPEDCDWNKKWIGLPTEEQLENILKPYFVDFLDLIENFYRFIQIEIENCKPKQSIQFQSIGYQSGRMTFMNTHQSIKELWLLFCQKILYNEVWNDKEKKWVKE